jgi:hypothetical protein
MTMSNRVWLPNYCNPGAFLPKIQETRTLFSHPPYLFPDFVARAMRFLQSETAEKMGFENAPNKTLPCRWKCSDESLFGATLAIYAYTGQYPFDKGEIGGNFNESSIAAAVHHGCINIDFGGSHTGYISGRDGGEFGRIWRPLQHEYSTNCGHLMGKLEPFAKVYNDACQNILLFSPDGEHLLISLPNEFIQPNWSSHSVKLMVDTDTLTTGDVPYDIDVLYTHTTIGRTLFYVNPQFIEDLPGDEAKAYMQKTPVPIDHNLTHRYFNIFDADTKLDEYGVPKERINLYIKFILSAQHTPYPLKAAIVNSNLEYNKLTDGVRAAAYKDYCFASFTGVFIDMYSEQLRTYVNLFQPLGISIKPAGITQCVELTPLEIFQIFDEIEPIAPVQLPLKMGETADGQKILDLFTYKPIHRHKA